ncbi:MAG: PcfJ domain-containing protein [Lachnospiraceae bacterium]|nr:PcfJ domain-containing protein [Lachnospiraceae bacterium]
MLETTKGINEFTPPELTPAEIDEILESHALCKGKNSEVLVIFKTEPYIDSFYVHFGNGEEMQAGGVRRRTPYEIIRFTFHPDYVWNPKQEELFLKKCRDNEYCGFDYGVMDEIFNHYSKENPTWHLQRYFTKSMLLLDHIYHCMKQNTVKEMLYKAGLFELAVGAELIDEVNLLATKPSDLYDGISIRSLRALNCADGAVLLSKGNYREMLKKLQSKFPVMFTENLNDAQCRYLQRLIDGNLTLPEIGRLYMARKNHLQNIWCRSQYEIFIQREQNISDIEALNKLDPIYADFIHKSGGLQGMSNSKVNQLVFYLLRNRDEYNRRIRVANRKRNYDWQERDHGYIIRFPQTIHDYCREAIYMSNCLMTYIEAMTHNDTTILFMRRPEDFTVPYITIEIYHNTLMQAYHRFNEECTDEEQLWIGEYCKRHDIAIAENPFDIL